MARPLITGIDIGSQWIRVGVCEFSEQGSSLLKFRALVKKEALGVRYGYIVNEDELANSIEQALREAEKQSRSSIERVVVSIGGVALDSKLTQSTVVISRADSEVTDADVDRIATECEQKLKEKSAYKIVHSIPIQYSIDGEKVLGKPQGNKGAKLEGTTMFILANSNHVSKLIKAVEQSGVEVDDILAAPIAESLVLASNIQKNAGCGILNIGSEATSLIVFEEGSPKLLHIQKIGGSDITKDIALGLKIPLDEAHDIKHSISHGGLAKTTQKKVGEIVSARLDDIFEIIDEVLGKIDRSGLLPAGMIISGGTALIPDIALRARDRLRIPAVVARGTTARLSPPSAPNNKEKADAKSSSSERYLYENIQGPEWSVVYGLCAMGSEFVDETNISTKIAKKTKLRLTRWIQQFLP